jgi:cystathionine gamma-synthase
MYLIDVGRVREIVGPDVIVTLDSSFAPPPNFYALRWGVDLALFSATKYLGGHGDIVAGVVSGRRDLIEEIRWFRDTTGPVADGNTAFLLRRSLYTLSLRMARVNEQGLAVARYLDAHPRVRRVYYTGLETHPHFKLGQDYLRGHGGVVTFELGLSEAATAQVVDRLAVPFMASNFGAPQTLVEQSTFFTYFEYDDEALRRIGVDRSTIRLALGYADDPEQVIGDLEQALAGTR